MGSKNHNNNNKNNESKYAEIYSVIREIKKLNKLSEMDESKYADEGGYADKVAKASNDLNSNQIRKFFSVVREIDMKHKNDKWDKIKPEFYLLKPKFAYASGRGNIPKPFYNLMMTTMSKVDTGDDKENYDNFKTYVNFFEAIVAYHKFHFPDK